MKTIKIHIQLIETVVERLPTVVMMTSILFASFYHQRLRYLVGLPLKSGFYVFLVGSSFFCSLWGIISSLINLRFDLIYKHIYIKRFGISNILLQKHGIFTPQAKFSWNFISNLIFRIHDSFQSSSDFIYSYDCTICISNWNGC